MTSSAPSTPSSSVATPLKGPFETTEEAIKVFLKVRPQTAQEVASNEACAIRKVSDRAIEVVPLTQYTTTAERYFFDHVFDEAQPNAEVYHRVVRDLVHSLFRGLSSLLFAYGVTNAGKTYTVHGTDHDAGLLPHALDDIFAIIDALQQPRSAAPQALLSALGVGTQDDLTFRELQQENERGTKFAVVLSCLEVYNEKLSDLLTPDTAGQRKELRMVEESGDITVTGLKEVEVNTVEDAKTVIAKARSKVQTNPTSLNGESSRSHSAFVISLFRYTAAALNIGEVVGKLVVCDLAGSERTNRTKNTGARLKEAANINQSLVVLGRCLEALRWNQTHPTASRQVVPYRESKITRLFQSTLSGNGKTVMVVNVSPCVRDLDESVHALKYSSIAKEVTTTLMGPPSKRKLQVRDGTPGGVATIQSLGQQVEEFKNSAWRKECDIRRELGRLWGQGIEELQQMLSMQLVTELRAKETLGNRKLLMQKEFYEARLARLQEDLAHKDQLILTATSQALAITSGDEPTLTGNLTAQAESWRTSQMRQLESRVLELQAQLEDERRRRCSVQRQLEAAAVAQGGSDEVARLQYQVSALREEGRDLEERLEQAQQRARQMEDQLQAETSERARVEREGGEQKKAARQATQKLESLEKALRATENIQQNQQRTIDSLTRANQHGTNTINSQNAIIEQRKQELQNYVRQEQRLKEELAQANQTNAMLSGVIAQLKEQLGQAQEDGASLRRRAKPSSAGSVELQGGDPHPLAVPAVVGPSSSVTSLASSASGAGGGSNPGSRRPSPAGGRKESPGRPPLRCTPRQQVEVHRIPLQSPPPPVNTAACTTAVLRKRSHSASTTGVAAAATPGSRSKAASFKSFRTTPATPQQPPAIELSTIAVDGVEVVPAHDAAPTHTPHSSRVTPQPRRTAPKRLSSEFDAAQQEDDEVSRTRGPSPVQPRVRSAAGFSPLRSATPSYRPSVPAASLARRSPSGCRGAPPGPCPSGKPSDAGPHAARHADSISPRRVPVTTAQPPPPSWASITSDLTPAPSPVPTSAAPTPTPPAPAQLQQPGSQPATPRTAAAAGPKPALRI